jgi:hypothetical protein
MKIHLWHFLYKLLHKAKRFPESVTASRWFIYNVNKAEIGSAQTSEIALYNLNRRLPEPMLLLAVETSGSEFKCRCSSRLRGKQGFYHMGRQVL